MDEYHFGVECVPLSSSDRVNHTHMVYQELWSNAAVGQQERGGRGGGRAEGRGQRGLTHSPNTCTWSLDSGRIRGFTSPWPSVRKVSA